MSRLLDFYRGQGTDTKGRHLKDIWTWEDDELEGNPEFIQWLFPLFTQYDRLLTEQDIVAFKSEPALQANLMKSFERILTFLGLSLTEDGKVVEGANFPARIPDVWSNPTNWRRITRILRSLTLLGMGRRAQALYDLLSAYYHSKRFPIPIEMFTNWTNAMGE